MEKSNEQIYEFYQINPFVRYVQKFVVTENAFPTFVQAYDYRIFYIYQGSGTIYFSDTQYSLVHGNLLIWKPGLRYRMSSNKNDTLILLGCNFDLTQNHSDLKHPIPPAREHDFDPEYVTENIVVSDNEAFDEIIFINNMFPAENLLLEMYNEYKTQKIFYQKRIDSMLLSLLCLCYRSISLGYERVGKAISTTKIDEIIQYIQEHYSEDITNKNIGQHFNYHPNYLNKQILSYTGKSLYQYILTYRIARAIDFLCTTDLTIAEIAEMVGFSNSSHFCKMFHRKTGMTPSAMRSPEEVSLENLDKLIPKK